MNSASAAAAKSRRSVVAVANACRPLLVTYEARPGRGRRNLSSLDYSLTLRISLRAGNRHHDRLRIFYRLAWD